MKAYPETYVAEAQTKLGCMLQVGVSAFDLKLSEFWSLFLASSYAVDFAAGDVSVLAGRSGEEMALAVLAENGRNGSAVQVLSGLCAAPLAVTPTYWTGWALAYYQWASGLAFSQIDHMISVDDVRNLYDPFHEMDIRAFCEEMDKCRVAAQPQAPLQAARLRAGISQSQLAMLSAVAVRSIQQYEQRQKNLDRASAQTVLSLARALCCSPEDLLEHTAAATYEYAVVAL